MAKSEPVGLGIGKFKLSNNHPFFIASVYHDGAWEALHIFTGKKTFDDLKDSIIINNDPRYYSEVVWYQYQHLINFLSTQTQGLENYIEYHDEIFYDICNKLAKAKGSTWLKLQSNLFYFLVSSYRKWHFRKASN